MSTLPFEVLVDIAIRCDDAAMAAMMQTCRQMENSLKSERRIRNQTRFDRENMELALRAHGGSPPGSLTQIGAGGKNGALYATRYGDLMCLNLLRISIPR